MTIGTRSAVSFAPHQRTLPSYNLPESALGMGASLGNSTVWLTTKSTGAIERVFNIELGENLVCAVSTRYGGTGAALRHPWTDGTHEESDVAFAGLPVDLPGAEVEIHPAYQKRRFSIGGALKVVETIFVPLCDEGRPGEEPVAYLSVELSNIGEQARRLRVAGFAWLRGSLPDDIEAWFDPNLRAIVARNRSRPEAVRIFGASRAPTRYGTTFDFASVYDPSHLHPLSNSTEASGDVLGGLQLDMEVDPGETCRFCFTVGTYARGVESALPAFAAVADYHTAFEKTVAHVRDSVERGHVLTPDPVINQGAVWSKVNMRRVMANYPHGRSFTNDPGVYSNVVVRDGAWFVYGNDHFMPDFSRWLLDKFAELQYANGKLPEYYDARTGRVEDDGLNINDDTPLFVLAVNHHYRSTGDNEWLERIFPAIDRAARYIMSQMDQRDLVYCNADDARGNVWAIASWRNIIANYSINGAVTEINAECAAALRAAAHLCENLKRPKKEAAEFRQAGERIRAAMDRHLRNPENGLYYLNVDTKGNPRTDVTGDEIFPVMFRTCDEETGFAIISRLNAPDFWTSAGLRTASRDDPRYDPSAHSGLIGGVWPGLTWWYAFAAARYHPEFMVRALRSSFEHYGRNPKAHNTVPGQFSEWFDGESLINRGMRLSPWEPPRFLWAAIEGVCGMMLAPGKPSINPLVPADWKWVALRRLPYHGDEFTYFATRQEGKFHIYATCDVESTHAQERFDHDVSPQVVTFSDAAAVVALRRHDELMLLLGNIASETTIVPVQLANVLEPEATYDARMYNSEREAWEQSRRDTGARLAPLAISIEAHGFRLLQFRRHT